MSEDQNRTFQDKFMLRFPDGMRERIKVSAELSGRSMNAEIIQRLKRSIDENEDERLKIDLPGDVWNQLMYDAGVQGVQMEERALEILRNTYDSDASHSAALGKVGTLATENSEMAELIAHMKEREDADFLAYYTKVVQLGAFVRSVLAHAPELPGSIKETAEDLLQLNAAEALTLRGRHSDAVFRQKLRAHSDSLHREMADEETDETPLDAEITIGDRIIDKS